MEIKEGIPSVENIVELLNREFDGWGSEDYFRWKYIDNPDFDVDDCGLYTNKKEVTSFSGVFPKDFVVKDDISPVLVWGDLCATSSLQDKGIYIFYKKKISRKCDEFGCKGVITFNNKSNPTFEAQDRLGWNYTELPLYIKLLSPKKAIQHYADITEIDNSKLNWIMEKFGDRVNLVFSDGKLKLSSVLSDDEIPEKENIINFDVHLTEYGTNRLVNGFFNEGKDLKSVVTGLLLKRHISFSKIEKDSSKEVSIPSGLNVEHKDNLREDEIDEVLEFYSTEVKSKDKYFGRTRDNLEHLLEYPYIIDILISRKNSEITGFLVLGELKQGEIREARVLEMWSSDRETHKYLIDECERIARKNKLDVIALFSDRKLRDDWIKINEQVMMWDEIDKLDSLQKRDLKINFYDVV